MVLEVLNTKFDIHNKQYLRAINCLLFLLGLVPNQVEEEDISAAKSDIDMDDDLLEEVEKVEEKKILTSEHLSKIYVFALVWGMGAYLETDDRLKYDAFIKDSLGFLDLPINDRKNPEV